MSDIKKLISSHFKLSINLKKMYCSLNLSEINEDSINKINFLSPRRNNDYQNFFCPSFYVDGSLTFKIENLTCEEVRYVRRTNLLVFKAQEDLYEKYDESFKLIKSKVDSYLEKLFLGFPIQPPNKFVSTGKRFTSSLSKNCDVFFDEKIFSESLLLKQFKFDAYMTIHGIQIDETKTIIKMGFSCIKIKEFIPKNNIYVHKTSRENTLYFTVINPDNIKNKSRSRFLIDLEEHSFFTDPYSN